MEDETVNLTILGLRCHYTPCNGWFLVFLYIPRARYTDSVQPAYTNWRSVLGQTRHVGIGPTEIVLGFDCGYTDSHTRGSRVSRAQPPPIWGVLSAMMDICAATVVGRLIE